MHWKNNEHELGCGIDLKSGTPSHEIGLGGPGGIVGTVVQSTFAGLSQVWISSLKYNPCGHDNRKAKSLTHWKNS